MWIHPEIEQVKITYGATEIDHNNGMINTDYCTCISKSFKSGFNCIEFEISDGSQRLWMFYEASQRDKYFSQIRNAIGAKVG